MFPYAAKLQVNWFFSPSLLCFDVALQNKQIIINTRVCTKLEVKLRPKHLSENMSKHISVLYDTLDASFVVCILYFLSCMKALNNRVKYLPE